MKPNESVKAFEDFTTARGLDLRNSTPREGIEATLDFQATTACPTCSDDMLLYQWGSYDWGAGNHFELNITRQFVEAELKDDDAISQLSLTYMYTPSPELLALGISNYWEDGPQDFRKFIFQSASFMAVAETKPDQIELFHEYV
jgi:hypothetical protein